MFHFNKKFLKKKLKIDIFFSKIFLIKLTKLSTFILINKNFQYFIFKKKKKTKLKKIKN